MGATSSISNLSKDGAPGPVSNKIGMTDLDTKLIVYTWGAIKDHKAIGEKIFRELFVIYPGIKKSFKFKEVPIDELVKEPRFSEHAANFTAFITVIVETFPDEEKILTIARAIGTKHASMAVFDSSLFDPSYWISFAFIATRMISKEVESDVKKQNIIQKTWQVLLFRLVIEMQVRFYKDLLASRGSVVTTSGPTAEQYLRQAKKATLQQS